MKLQLKQTLRKIWARLYNRDLKNLAILHGTDKYGAHYYIKHYLYHFKKLRSQKLNVLEIGVGGYQNPQKGGNSLRMWRDFFPKSHIFGIDIHDKSYHDEKRIKTFRGSQTDGSFLQKVKREMGDIHIIIDDGSHINEHVISTFKCLFPLLDKNGIYVIEDTQTSYWETIAGTDWGGARNLDSKDTIMSFFKSLVDGLNYEEFTIPAYSPTYFDKHIVSMHFYHNLIFIYKGDNSEGSNMIRNGKYKYD